VLIWKTRPGSGVLPSPRGGGGGGGVEGRSIVSDGFPKIAEYDMMSLRLVGVVSYGSFCLWVGFVSYI